MHKPGISDANIYAIELIVQHMLNGTELIYIALKMISRRLLNVAIVHRCILKYRRFDRCLLRFCLLQIEDGDNGDNVAHHQTAAFGASLVVMCSARSPA
jgi:hypothetical protein